MNYTTLDEVKAASNIRNAMTEQDKKNADEAWEELVPYLLGEEGEK